MAKKTKRPLMAGQNLAVSDPLLEDWQFLRRPDAVTFARSLGLPIPTPETNLDWITVWALIGWELYDKRLNGPRTGRPPRWNAVTIYNLAVYMQRSGKDWSKSQSALGFAKFLKRKYPNEFREKPESLAPILSSVFKMLQREIKKSTQ